MVSVFGFNDELDVFVDLFLLDFGGNGFNHIAAGENFVQHAFAENFIPAAGAARGDTADDHGFFAAVVRSGARAGRSFGCRGLDGSFGFFHGGGVARYPVYKSGVKSGVVAVHIGTVPIQVDAGRDEVGEQVVKFHNTAFFGVVRGQDFDVLLVGQGVGGQGGKHAFGAAFHKQAYAGIVSGLQLFNPFHGVGNLRDHKVFDFLRIGRIEFRRHVGGNGHRRRVEFQRVQERAVLRHSGANDGGVESVRNRNLHCLNTHIRKHFNRVVNRFGGAGDYGLRRAVFVGYGHVTVNARKFRFHAFHGGGDGSHFAVVLHFNFGHYFTAGANGFETVFKIENTGGDGGGVFAQAVAHHYVGLNAERGQQAHHRDVRR